MSQEGKRAYVDKDGDAIDLSIIYGVYKTKEGIAGFFRRMTTYTPEEIDEAVAYIMSNVQPAQYDFANARRMMAQIEGHVPEEAVEEIRAKPPAQQPSTQPMQASASQSGGGVCCPNCGSTNLQIVADVQGKGASFCKLCACGLLGLCGVGKTTTTHYWICQNCGKKFKA